MGKKDDYTVTAVSAVMAWEKGVAQLGNAASWVGT
jgi:hypothetical protein